MGWWIAAIITWLASAACILVTCYEIISGKKKIFSGENIGAYFFHGGTAILALWFLAKAVA